MEVAEKVVEVVVEAIIVSKMRHFWILLTKSSPHGDLCYMMQEAMQLTKTIITFYYIIYRYMTEKCSLCGFYAFSQTTGD